MPTITIFNLETAIKKAVINLYKLNEEDSYVLVFSVDEGIVIPFVKTSDGRRLGYIPTDIPKEKVNKINEIINEMFGKKLLPFKHCKALPCEMPEFKKEISTFVGLTSDSREGKFSHDLLVKSGYTFPETVVSAPTFKKRDWTALVKRDETAKAFLDENKALVEKTGVQVKDMPVEARVNQRAIENGLLNGMLLVGPTGTGKSFMCRVLSQNCGSPLLTIQIDRDTRVENLEGEEHANTDPDAKSPFVFVPGPLLRAHDEGYSILIDEANLAEAGVMSCLHKYCDASQYICVHGKYHKRHPNFVIYMTMNPGYEGTQVLNMALKNRFPIVQVGAWTKEKFAEKMIDYSKNFGGGVSKEFANKLFDFSSFIYKEGHTHKWGGETFEFSIRNGQRFLDAIYTEKSTKEELAAALYCNYINVLSLDNDNSVKLQELKESEDVQNFINELYDLYDFKDCSLVEREIMSFDEIVKIKEVPKIDEKLTKIMSETK